MASRRELAKRELRASDADREQVVALLRERFGAGRLSEEEFSARLDSAYGSATLAELEALARDLPDEPRAGRAMVPYRKVDDRAVRTEDAVVHSRCRRAS